MLAYVFWHRPRADVDAAQYEDRLRAFHAQLGRISASFRVMALPFSAADGYEDWYPVEDWSALGSLSALAVSGECRAPHDLAAGLAGEGWGGVYALVRGKAGPPLNARWVSKPRGQPYQGFLDSLPAPTVWQRQMVLGPAPEFCLVDDVGGERHSPSRIAVYPVSATSSSGQG